MADQSKPTISQDPKPGVSPSITTPSTGGEPENKRDASGDQTITVRALKVFHKEGDMRGDMTKHGDEFTVDRARASQLRANGLIEYVNDGDAHAIHGEVDAKRIDDHVALRDEAGKIPANSKGSPLRNPEIKLADLKDVSGSKK